LSGTTHLFSRIGEYIVASNNNIKIYFKYFRKAVPMTPEPFTRSCGTP
jgi:hypothetical protein